MGSYTETMEENISEIDPEDEDYEVKLVAITQEFLNFGELLVRYLEGRYPDTAQDGSQLSLLKQLFREAGMKAPRNMEKWFAPKKAVEKDTAYQICFALGLNEAEVETFFRKVYLNRAFDFHKIWDVVYYFAFSHGLSYEEAQNLLQDVNAIAVPERAGNEKFYTAALKAEILKIRTKEDLMRFFYNHKAEYVTNNVTAFAEIRGLWQAISGENGLAVREHNLYLDYSPNDEPANGGKVSVWDTFLLILDFSGDEVKPVAENPNARTISPILNQLNPLIKNDFPDRNGIEKILRENHNISDDKVRKMLIFLTFYKSLAEAALRKKSYRLYSDDTEKYITIINKFLIDAGYPELYVGNPYDWLFCYLLCQNESLPIFREFFRHLLVELIDPEKEDAETT